MTFPKMLISLAICSFVKTVGKLLSCNFSSIRYPAVRAVSSATVCGAVVGRVDLGNVVEGSVLGPDKWLLGKLARDAAML